MQLANLLKQNDRFRALLTQNPPVLNASAPTVSAWNIGQHLDHCLKVNNVIIGSIEKGQPSQEPGITFLGRAVLLLGFIPRGRGKSPKAVLPQAATTAQLYQILNEERGRLEKLAQDSKRILSPERVMKHPRFGWLTAFQALRFLGIHNEHHLKIIRDIRKRG